jgi:putative nucleotidyltransferase with HDIG domain
MNDPSTFLYALGQALAVMGLYAEGHPSRERAIDAAFAGIDGLADATGKSSFTFLDGEVVYGRDPMRDFKDWDWGNKLSGAGIQRIEVERKMSRDEFDGFLQELYARVTHSTPATGENRQMRTLGVRFGSVGVHGLSPDATPTAPPALATLSLSLGEEVETLRWLQGEVQSDRGIPLFEAEAIVRSLSVAMHADRQTILPLLQLKEFDQYTTTHSLNVAVLSMALAESLGLRSLEVRAFGVAGLLHDIGKIRIPIEVLTKPGKLSAEEMTLIRRHPIDGAEMILQSDQELDLAAVVAYEHHMMLDGCGYPATHYGQGRPSTLASRLIHVCDVFDALRTKRPYREAWEADVVFAYLLEHAGSDFDPELVTPFIDMMRRSQLQISDLPDEPAIVTGDQSPLEPVAAAGASTGTRS